MLPNVAAMLLAIHGWVDDMSTLDAALVERQIALEAEMQGLGPEQLRSRLARAKGRGEEAD